MEVADAGGVSTRRPPARRLRSRLVSRQLAQLEAELGVQLARAKYTRRSSDGGGGHVPRPCSQSHAPRSTWPGKRSYPTVNFAAACGSLCRLLSARLTLAHGAQRKWHDATRSSTSIPSTVIASSISSQRVSIVRSGSAIFRTPTLIARCCRTDLRKAGRRARPISRRMERLETPERAPRTIKRSCRAPRSWQLTDGDQIVTVHPRGRFKADNGTAARRRRVGRTRHRMAPRWRHQ